MMIHRPAVHRSRPWRWFCLAAAVCVTLTAGPGSGCTRGGLPLDSGPRRDVLTAGPDGWPADAAPLTDTAQGPPTRIRLATFNVQNFFDEVDDPGKDDTVLPASEVAAKIHKLGVALRRLDADVLALQEVENRALLLRLRDEQLAAMGYEYARLVEGNDYRGMDVALLSRLRVPRVVSHAADRFNGVDGDDATYGFSRDCLEVTIEAAAGRSLVLLINHLRAKDGTTEADLRRQAQARRVREIADETLSRDPGANLAVVGDLNDLPDSLTLSLLRSGAPPLRDIVELLPADQRYTFVYRGEREQVDYILVSPGLEADLVHGSVEIDHHADFAAVSDHYPVAAEFVVN